MVKTLTQAIFTEHSLSAKPAFMLDNARSKNNFSASSAMAKCQE